MNLLIGLGIPHSVIYDDDNNKGEHKDINKLIKESAHSKLTFKTKPIMGEFENLLGIPALDQSYPKPQYALYLYEIGAIDEAKLRELCDLVESCLPVQT